MFFYPARLAGHPPAGRQGFRTFEWERAIPFPEEATALIREVIPLI